MNLIQLVMKQMRQRALSTALTLLSVVLGVSLAIAILVFQREGDKLFGQGDFGYDLLVGAKGAKLQLVLNTVYQLGDVPTTIPYAVYEELAASPLVAWAIPWAMGDNYRGFRVIGTSALLFGRDEQGNSLTANVPEYRIGRRFELAEGRAFHARKFEAILGADVKERTDLRIGSRFKASHGAENRQADNDEHDEQWEVVGTLKPTHTAMDRVIFIPLVSAYAVPSHGKALGEIAKVSDTPSEPQVHEAESGHHHHHDHEGVYEVSSDGTIELEIPKEQWRVTAVLVRSIADSQGMLLTWQINNGPRAMAVSPAWEMRTFFSTFLRGSTQVLLIVATLVMIVAAVSILVSIYNSVSARLKEIAILRALGATRVRILLLICLEAGIVGLVGAMVGLVVGHLASAAGSAYMQQVVGERIQWLRVSQWELLYVAGVVILSLAAGLVPAMKAYRTPVATNLVAS